MSDIFLRLAAGSFCSAVIRRIKALVCTRALAWVLLTFHLPLHAQQPLIWGYVHFPPFTSQGKDGNVEGFLADITKEAMEAAEIPYMGVELPNRRAIALINSGDIHFGLFAKSFMRDPKQFIVSEFPVSQIELLAFWLGENKAVNSEVDLIGKKLILMTAYTYGGLREFFQDPANKISIVANIEHHHRAFQALKVGRGDYLLDYRGPSLRALKSVDLPDIKFSTLKTIDIYFVMHKSYPDAQRHLRTLQDEFVKLFGPGKIRMDENH